MARKIPTELYAIELEKMELQLKSMTDSYNLCQALNDSKAAIIANQKLEIERLNVELFDIELNYRSACADAEQFEANNYFLKQVNADLVVDIEELHKVVAYYENKEKNWRERLWNWITGKNSPMNNLPKSS